MLKEKIRQLASEFHDEIVAVRRHLHAHPELSYQEEETSRFVAAKLGEWGISHQTGVAGHGIVGEIRGGKGAGRVIALRADMDALPIQEANDVPYRSQNPGVMHACGHDVHTASLLGAARILQSLSAEWSGVVKLLFQPAEERLPGGAKLMIEAGVLENPVPELIIGQHVHPPLAAGRVGLRPGRYMASADELYFTVKGRGGHGALPHDCVDPILVASHLIVALQQLVSRRSDPTIPSVLTIGKIESEGGSTNVIPNAVHMMGTFRTMDEQWRAEAHELMERLVDGLVRSMGASCEFKILKGYPFLVNEPALTERIRRMAEEYLGAENVVDLPIRMTAEDFAYYSQRLSACFYRLGTGNESKGITSPVHTDTFDVDEESLLHGMGLMAWLAAGTLTGV